jgi:hypothetical protein
MAVRCARSSAVTPLRPARVCGALPAALDLRRIDQVALPSDETLMPTADPHPRTRLAPVAQKGKVRGCSVRDLRTMVYRHDALPVLRQNLRARLTSSRQRGLVRVGC